MSPPPQQTDFFSPRPAEFVPEAPSTGHLYLAFTNQTALGQLEAMWKQYAADPEQKFPDGLAPLRNVFKHLINIRPWDAEDRLRESGLQEDWQERIQDGAELVPVEVELWYRQAASERSRRSAVIRQRVLDEQAQSTVEYALVLLGAAAVALALVAWVTRSDAVSRLFDAIVGRILSQAG